MGSRRGIRPRDVAGGPWGLKARGWPTVVYLDGPADAMRAYACETLRVGRRRLDMARVARVARVARECDAAVLHGGQGATAAVLLAGKPVLLVPSCWSSG